MDQWSEDLFTNLSQLVQRKSKAASVSPQYDNVIPIAIYLLRTTEAEDLRAIMFGQE